MQIFCKHFTKPNAPERHVSCPTPQTLSTDYYFTLVSWPVNISTCYDLGLSGEGQQVGCVSFYNALLLNIVVI